jgi:hypothetical protein
MNIDASNTSISQDKLARQKCHCCGCILAPDLDIHEFQESLHIRYHAGCGSRFIADGSLVECILCQSCTHEILGCFLRITPNHASHSESHDGIPWTAVQQLYFSMLESTHRENGKNDDDK